MSWKTLEPLEILSFLKKQKQPVEEQILLRNFFPEVSDFQGLHLFRCHFNLYHYLYCLKDRLQDEGLWKLHIQLSKCYLLEIPVERCRFFLEKENRFCSKETTDSRYCSAHLLETVHTREEELPGFQGIGAYYLDRTHYSEMDEGQLDRMTRGMNKWLASAKEIDQSLTTLDLSENFTLERLKSRYRYLVREHHPDRQGNEKDFHKIRTAYLILKYWKEDNLE